MTSSPARRPAWVVPSLLVAVFTVVYLVLRVVLGDDTGPSAFPTQHVPEPTTSALSSKETPQTDELGLTGDGIGPHRLGDDAPAVLEALTDVLGPPTEDASEECAPGLQTRWVRWADLSIRLHSGQFVAYIEGIYYPPGPPPLAIPTAKGLAPGDPATRLFELYDPASLRQVPAPAPSEQEVTQFEIIAEGARPLVVIVEGTAETGTVVAISAGSFCS
jgi:hypothetical protein